MARKQWVVEVGRQRLIGTLAGLPAATPRRPRPHAAPPRILFATGSSQHSVPRFQPEYPISALSARPHQEGCLRLPSMTAGTATASWSAANSCAERGRFDGLVNGVTPGMSLTVRTTTCRCPCAPIRPIRNARDVPCAVIPASVAITPGTTCASLIHTDIGVIGTGVIGLRSSAAKNQFPLCATPLRPHSHRTALKPPLLLRAASSRPQWPYSAFRPASISDTDSGSAQ